ncbi:hypothetical protein [Luedemannella helvata]|uniref:Uncharacterized protein n=1 Tax=Luedemannella helvata TaxID=349315 RepID=A0ABN2JXE0_9ACTN
MVRRTVTVLLSLTIVLGLPFVGAQSASAHDTSAAVNTCGSGSARCGYGGVTNNHTRVYACDTYADGYGFRTFYRLKNEATGYIDDANGATSGCSAAFVGTTSNPVVTFWVIWKNSYAYVWRGPYTA